MHVVARTAKQVHVTGTVGHESAGLHEITRAVDHGQARAERESQDTVEIRDDQLVDHDIERVRPRVELLEYRSDVLPASHLKTRDVEIEFTRRGLGIGSLKRRLVVAAIEDDGQSAKLRDELP